MSRPLKINLVPRLLWNKSLAHVLPNWSEVRDKVCSCGCCAICDTKAPPNKLHAHEVWKYNDDDHTVDLSDIIPVCENCHMTLHIGKANVDGKLREATKWYCQVNGVSREIGKHQINSAFEWWRIRSDYPWRFNRGISDKVEQITGINCSVYHTDYVTYLNVPYAQKDEVKALGARWDMRRMMWCVSNDKLQTQPDKFLRWLIREGDVSSLLNGDKEPERSEQPVKPLQDHDTESNLLAEIMRGI